MHPEVQMNQPGKCPKCGMELVEKTIKVAAPKPAPKKAVEKPKPPVQKQATQVQKQQPKAEQQQEKVVYTCPMHPELQMDKPGKCPKCGMTLVKKTPDVPGQKPVDQKVAPQAMEGHQHHEQEGGAADTTAFQMKGERVNMQPGKTVVYHLYVRDTIVNYTGKQKQAYAINGSIPSPTLVFTEGDTAEIYLHNQLKNGETSLHWHGVILPNEHDGVPYLTTKRIGPGDVHLYKFRVVQNGTYWYHSHSALQEQQGMYGALIFKKREGATMEPMAMDHAAMGHASGDHGAMQHTTTTVPNSGPTAHYNVVLSEWTDNDPTQIQRRLRTGNDWFSIKKGSTQSYGEAIKEGRFKTKFINEWKRMKAMDVSDVFYERFLVNGQPQTNAQQFKAGDRVMLHVVNAGASSYFWLQYGGGKITVVANDGNETEPIEVDRMIIAPAETYDLIVTIPQNMSYELRATSEDRTGASSLWLGSGMNMPAPKLPRLKYFEGMQMMNAMMKTNGTMKDMGMNMSLQQMDMNSVMYPEITGGQEEGKDSETDHTQHQQGAQQKDTAQAMEHSQHNMQNMQSMDHAQHGMQNSSGIVTLNYGMLRAPFPTEFPEGPVKTLHFSLTDNMNRYVWTMDIKPVNEADSIPVEQGEILRVIMTNNSMMRHPMHLHGHDFRVLNRYGSHAPLKNVLDIMPMERDTIEFAANQEGRWFFHCHILYHMMAGMGRVFTYQNWYPNPQLPDGKESYKMFLRDNSMYHLMVRAGIESNGSEGEAIFSTNRYAVQGIWHMGYTPHHGHEVEINVGRYLGVNQWLFPYIGFDYHYQKEQGDVKDEPDYKNLFGQVSNKDNRRAIVAGIQYTLPWLVLADGRVDSDGKFRFQLSREDIPITSRLRFNFMGNTDKEYMAGFRYIVSKWFALSTHYDSDMGLGAGVTLTY
jgi:FtsP/CotA-like multicopper oxidase with cupredoxin domain